VLLKNRFDWTGSRWMNFATPQDGGDGTQGVPAPPGGDNGQSTSQDGEEPFDKERAMALLNKYRGFEKEAKRLQKLVDDAAAAEKARADQEMSAVERAEKKAQEAEDARKLLESKYRTTAINNAIRLQATTANFIDVEDAIQLVDRSTIDINEQEQVTGAKEAIAALAKAKPHLVGQPRPTVPNINATERGQPPAPSIETVIAAKRQSGEYSPF
jgi:hypothetical protein